MSTPLDNADRLRQPSMERVEWTRGGMRRFVNVEPSATRGAMVGRDLYDPDGNIIADLGAYVGAGVVAKDTKALNGVPADKIITPNGTLIVKQIQAEAIQAGDLQQNVQLAGGRITATAGGNTLALGVNMGSLSDLLLWYGPTPANLEAALVKANGAFWIDETGEAFFAGGLAQGKVVTHLAGNGTNVMWEEYSLYSRAQVLLPSTSPAFGDHVGLSSLQTVADPNAIGGFSLQATTTAIAGHVRFAATDTDNNLIIGGNKKYLVSYYARASVGGVMIRPWVRGDMAVDYGHQALTAARARYSFVVDASAVSQANVHFGFFTNPAGGPAASVHSVYVDGWMIEPLVGDVTAPSPFSPGPSARQTRRAMINQNIIDGGRNLVQNPGLVWNLVGAATAGWLAEQAICDGWKCGLAHGSLTTQRTVSDWKTGAWELVAQWGNNPPALANGQTARCILMVAKSWAVIPGERFVASVRAKSDFNTALPAGVTGIAYLRCAFYDAAMTFISYGFTTIARAAGWVKYATDPMAAPANAAFMDVRLDFNIVNASGVAQTPAAGLFPWILQATDFEVYRLTNLDDDVEDGATYGRYGLADGFLSGGIRRIGLRISGSGHRIGDQRNLPQSLVTALGSVRTATALTATSAGAVSVNAHTVRYGASSVSYSAVANAVTGLSVGVKYWIYCTDADFAGGVRTWSASTDITAVMNGNDGVVVAGAVTIPSSGSSGGGGAGDCVVADEWVCERERGWIQAGDVAAGDWLLVWDEQAATPGEEWVQVEANALAAEPCWELCAGGAVVAASANTPMTLRDGRTVPIWQMEGEAALVRRADGATWEAVTGCRYLGYRPVAHIRVRQRCYFAGRDPAVTIATHNPTYKP